MRYSMAIIMPHYISLGPGLTYQSGGKTMTPPPSSKTQSLSPQNARHQTLKNLEKKNWKSYEKHFDPLAFEESSPLSVILSRKLSKASCILFLALFLFFSCHEAEKISIIYKEEIRWMEIVQHNFQYLNYKFWSRTQTCELTHFETLYIEVSNQKSLILRSFEGRNHAMIKICLNNFWEALAASLRK